MSVTTAGLISGTPTSDGTFPVSVTATNGSGTGSSPLVITINPAPPVITSALAASGQEGQPFNYQIAASNSPTNYGATGLPSGLSVDTTMGVISGTPAAGTGGVSYTVLRCV